MRFLILAAALLLAGCAPLQLPPQYHKKKLITRSHSPYGTMEIWEGDPGYYTTIMNGRIHSWDYVPRPLTSEEQLESIQAAQAQLDRSIKEDERRRARMEWEREPPVEAAAQARAREAEAEQQKPARENPWLRSKR